MSVKHVQGLWLWFSHSRKFINILLYAAYIQISFSFCLL